MVSLSLQKSKMQTSFPLDVELAFRNMGIDEGINTPQLLWAHGWMQSHNSLIHLAHSLESIFSHLLIDFPGFGKSPKPPDSWGTKEYADQIAAWLKNIPSAKRIWVGYSFGCRVGIQLSANYPELVHGMVLIAAPGLPHNLSNRKTIKTKIKINTYKIFKKLIPYGLSESWLKNKFGSRDYKNAGMLRKIFVRVASENLTNVATKVSCPVLLIYGDKDTETPFSIGQRYTELMQNASLSVIKQYDHHTILSTGQHQVLQRLHDFVENIIA